jgi:hypothetical protein
MIKKTEGLSDRFQSLAHCLKACVTDIIFASKEGFCNISPKVKHGFVLNSEKIWKY